LTTKTLGY